MPDSWKDDEKDPGAKDAHERDVSEQVKQAIKAQQANRE
jgi:hypothetical protein